jgi:Homeodomain-like domain-containing protein
VAGTDTGVKKYVVKLSPEERGRLEALIGSGKRSAQLITKARILLKADTSDAGDGWTDRQIAAALDTSVNTVGSARRQLVEEGFEATLVRKYNPNSVDCTPSVRHAISVTKRRVRVCVQTQ